MARPSNQLALIRSGANGTGAVALCATIDTMPDRSRKRPIDVNELAAQIVGEATGEVEPEPDERNPAAVELGRRGGLKGGR